jgi:hypothetical protein
MKTKDSVRYAVAKVVAKVPAGDGLKNHFIHRAHPGHPYSCGQRFRELRSEAEGQFRQPANTGCRFDPKTNTFDVKFFFKLYCRRVVRDYELN